MPLVLNKYKTAVANGFNPDQARRLSNLSDTDFVTRINECETGKPKKWVYSGAKKEVCV